MEDLSVTVAQDTGGIIVLPRSIRVHVRRSCDRRAIRLRKTFVRIPRSAFRSARAAPIGVSIYEEADTSR